MTLGSTAVTTDSCSEDAHIPACYQLQRLYPNLWGALRVALTLPLKWSPLLSETHRKTVYVLMLSSASVRNLLRCRHTMTSLTFLRAGNADLCVPPWFLLQTAGK